MSTMLQSLFLTTATATATATATNPSLPLPLPLPPLFLRLPTRTKPSPPPPPPRLRITIPCACRGAKDKTFNVHVEVEEDDDPEERLHCFNREVARSGLLRECWRRRFHENARDKRLRKHRQAALLRRRRSRRTQPSGSGVDKDHHVWALSEESFDQLVEEDEDQSNEELDSYFRHDDGQGTWDHFSRNTSS